MRRRAAKKREIIPDSQYGSVLITKFINRLMYQGKKSIAETIVYAALADLAKVSKTDAVSAFEEALNNVRPQIEVRSRRVGGATYQVPVEVRSSRSFALAMKWVINYARSRHGRTMVEKLSAELVDAFNKRGAARKKKEDVQKMAESNRAFAHYNR
ncbi:MAG: 30S ribosomal protein S7 [Rickettsiales bacterium]|jgi:small subunit ribosomal protein S7|nr:30S ribosomal protein S7 [Rickettsiales bacterium]